MFSVKACSLKFGQAFLFVMVDLIRKAKSLHTNFLMLH